MVCYETSSIYLPTSYLSITSETHGGPAGDCHWNLIAGLLRDGDTSRRNCPFNRVGVPLHMLGRFVQEFPSQGKRESVCVRERGKL